MYSVGGTNVLSKAYILTTDKNIWQYNIITDNWIMKTIFPGKLEDRIISFSNQNKIYFGLSYKQSYELNESVDRQFWMYDLTSDAWKMLEKFPLDLNYAAFFSFSLKGKLYICFWFNGSYNIWKFDPSRI
jgi:hypothetical protein